MKQKVLLYTEKGSNDPNIDLFCHEYFYRDFEPIAILTSISGGGGSPMYYPSMNFQDRF